MKLHLNAAFSKQLPTLMKVHLTNRTLLFSLAMLTITIVALFAAVQYQIIGQTAPLNFDYADTSTGFNETLLPNHNVTLYLRSLYTSTLNISHNSSAPLLLTLYVNSIALKSWNLSRLSYHSDVSHNTNVSFAIRNPTNSTEYFTSELSLNSTSQRMSQLWLAPLFTVLPTITTLICSFKYLNPRYRLIARVRNFVLVPILLTLLGNQATSIVEMTATNRGVLSASIADLYVVQLKGLWVFITQPVVIPVISLLIILADVWTIYTFYAFTAMNRLLSYLATELNSLMRSDSSENVALYYHFESMVLLPVWFSVLYSPSHYLPQVPFIGFLFQLFPLLPANLPVALGAFLSLVLSVSSAAAYRYFNQIPRKRVYEVTKGLIVASILTTLALSAATVVLQPLGTVSAVYFLFALLILNFIFSTIMFVLDFALRKASSLLF